MKKTISLFLCLIITFSFVSCTAAEPEIVPEYDSSIPEDGLDLNGAVIIIGGENAYETRADILNVNLAVLSFHLDLMREVRVDGIKINTKLLYRLIGPVDRGDVGNGNDLRIC